MRSIKMLLALAIAACVQVVAVDVASAAETCGNGVDDDADGYADEGCGFANWVTGVCESPVSCRESGDADPVTGAWVYQVPPDIAPQVAFGPKFEFRRTYMSMYSPPAISYRTAMGNRWQHNFQSWLDKSGTSVVVHLPSGQDVKFTYTNTPGDGYDYYNAFQPGAHFKWLRQATASPNNWELRTLTGEVYKYNWSSPVGKLSEIWDTLATPNKVLITYFTNGPNNGQIDTVTDASGKKRFKFSYSSGRVSSVAYQTVSGNTGTTRVTLSLSYASANPTTIQIGGTTTHTNTYSSAYLTQIADGAGNSIVETAYAASAPGKVVRVTTPRGGIGYQTLSTDPQCSGGTVLFSNLANTASCDATTPCSSGYRCGGQTGAALGGKCYRAARCLSTTSPSENLITTAASMTPCTGACAPRAQYSWNTTTLDLKGIKLADNNWSSFSRNGDGLVTVMAEGDTDDDPTNAGGAKTWFFYGDANFPGRVTEKRRRTDTANGGASGCSGVSDTGCKRTQFSWNGDGLLGTKTELGYTDGGFTAYTYIVTYAYDPKGRLTLIDEPLSGSNDVTEFTYWTSADVFKDGYRNLIKRKRNATDYLITTLDGYDYFGNPGSTQDPDGTYTCRTWDANRNYVSQTREAMAGQTSCSTSNSSDLTTSFVRDSLLRLTRATLPLGDCQHKEYDAWGRITNSKLRDDCVAANAGSTFKQYYDANGLPTTTESIDSAGVVKRRHIGAFSDGAQIESIQNPVSPSYSRTFSYFPDGAQERGTFEDGIGKTEFVRDAQNRVTTHRRALGPSGALSWTLGYPSTNNTSTRLVEQVTDPVSKIVQTFVDDMGRRTSIVSPDSGTTQFVYDAASRLVTRVDALGSLQQFTHAYTWDNLGRKLTEDYGTEVSCPSDPVDVTYRYDDGPASTSCPGVTLTSGCPTGATCTRLAGRLAHVKTVLLCPAGGSAVYQETFYGYDDAGRMISEFICDTTGRTALQTYSWDKNGNLVEVTAPSSASMTSTYGGAGNSDANLVTAIARSVGGSPSNLISNVTWAPFGPPDGYTMANVIGGLSMKAMLTWNLAYRATQLKYGTTSENKTTIDYTEDAKGRYTQKLYSNVHSNILNDYIQYDWLDRPVCDSPTSGACPTTSTLSQFTTVGYNSSNDRSSLYHKSPFFGEHAYTVNYATGSDKVASITSATAGNTTVDWNDRGDRWYEDNDNSAVDRREYTYDGKSRVRNILGKFLQGISFFRDYRITLAYDHRDRVVFRSFVNVTLGGESQQFYYWDLNDRLIEVRVVPNIADTSTYTVYNFYWLGQHPVAIWATSFPSATTARYFVHTDEANRVLEVYDWPSSGDATLVWGINPDTFGWDSAAVGSIYQPLRMNNSLFLENTAAYKDNIPTLNRPGLLIDRGRVYDPMTESFLTRIGEFPGEPFTFGNHDPTSLGTAIASQDGGSTTRGSCRGNMSSTDLDLAPPSDSTVILKPKGTGGGLPSLCYDGCTNDYSSGAYACSICSTDPCARCGFKVCEKEAVLDGWTCWLSVVCSGCTTDFVGLNGIFMY